MGTSLERVLSVLDLFTEEKLEWTSEEIGDYLGCSRPTVYRYLKALTACGLLSSSAPGVFTVGAMVVELDYVLRMSDPLLLAGTAPVDRLADQYPATAMLLRWYRNKILCVYSKSSLVKPRSSYVRGRPMALGRGAISHSIMASLPRRQLMPLIREYIGDLRDVGFGQGPDEIYDTFKRLRRQRVCVARSEVTPGVIGTSSAIVLSSGRSVGAVCLTVAASDATEELLKNMSESVRGTVVEIGAGMDSAQER